MISIRPARADAPDILPLHKAREIYAAALYPAESNHLLDIADMLRPQMNFFAAYDGEQVLGCGGFWAHYGFVEIKSMWVEPAARGRKIGRLLLETIEREAQGQGFTLARLETGIHQPEAITLYRKSGYRDIPPFADYKPDVLSLFMEKALG